jgi:hypothetical protein
VSQTGAARLILPQTLAVAWHSYPSRRPAAGPTCQRERSGSAHHLHYSQVPARRAGSRPRRCMAGGAHRCPASSSSTTHDARSTTMSSLPLLPPSHVRPPDALQAQLPFLSPTLSSSPLAVLDMALPRRPGAAARKLDAHGAAAGPGQPAWASARGPAACGAARSQRAAIPRPVWPAGPCAPCSHSPVGREPAQPPRRVSTSHHRRRRASPMAVLGPALRVLTWRAACLWRVANGLPGCSQAPTKKDRRRVVHVRT